MSWRKCFKMRDKQLNLLSEKDWDIQTPYIKIFTGRKGLKGCGGLTLAGCQVPTKLLYHSPPQQDRGRKYDERFVGQDKDREITQQLPS